MRGPIRIPLFAFFAGVLALGQSATSQEEPTSRPAAESASRPTSAPTSRPSVAELARYRAAAAYSERVNGKAMLVMVGGRIVFEDYTGGFDAERPHYLASGTKSFCGAMAAAAVQDGLLELDEPAAKTLEEWREDPMKSKITIRHLLTLSSGLEPGPNGEPPPYDEAIRSSASFEPGTHFAYGPVPFQCFGEIMRRKLIVKKESPLDYMKRRIFEPIGMKVALWRHGPDALPQLPSGAHLTAREWVKFGNLLLQGGVHGEQRLLDEKALAVCFAPSPATDAYGMTFWLASDPDVDLPLRRLRRARRQDPPTSRPAVKDPRSAGFAMAAGAFNQRLYLLPALDMVVVRFGDGGTWDDRRFLQLLLGHS